MALRKGSKNELDHTRTEEFVQRALADAAAFTTVLLAGIGDRFGLFKDLSSQGPATAADLAKRTGIQERYAREWLGAMAAAGYVDYDPGASNFSLPEPHVPVLAEEGGPMFFGALHGELLGMTRVMDRLVDAFSMGGGVPQDHYPLEVYDCMDRFTSMWHNNLLVQQWIPAVPEVKARLEEGIRVADVGCGRGRAIVNLAKAFPRSTYMGYDNFEPNIRFARRLAQDNGVQDRARFELLDASQGLPRGFDLITTFDVIHDARDPRGLLRAVREALNPGGTYLCLDINCSDKLEENLGPMGALHHGVSVLYCMTTSLAVSGEGLGTLGLPEPKLGEFAREAGFRQVRRLPLDNPFNNLYELKA